VKKTTKFLAVLMVIALIAGMVPMVALADVPADISAIIIKGEATGFGASAFEDYATVENDFEDATVEFELSDVLIADTDLAIIAWTTTADNAVAYLFLTGDAAITDVLGDSINNEDDLEAAIATGDPLVNGVTDTALVDGAVIWLMDGTENDTVAEERVFLRIVIAEEDEVIVTPPGGSTASTGDIEIETEVNNPVFNVVLPLNIKFALDPMQLANESPENGNQISAADYKIVNKSNFAVKASFEIEAEKASNLTIVGMGVAPVATTTLKQAYFGIVGAATASMTGLTFADTAGGSFTYDPKAAGTLNPFVWDDDDGEAGIEFILGRATSLVPGTAVDTLATGTKGVASFNFYGELNTMQVWAVSDIQLSGVYKLAGVLPLPYAVIDATTVGVNQIPDASFLDYDLVLGAPGTYTISIDRAVLDARLLADEVGLKLLFTLEPTFASVRNAVSGGVWAPGVAFNYANGEFDALWVSGFSGAAGLLPGLVFSSPSGNYVLFIDYTDCPHNHPGP